MNQDNQLVMKFVKIAFMAFAAIFSLVATILVFVTDFGGWWEGGGSNYYFWVGAPYAPAWAQLFLVLLGLLFLALLGISVFLGILTLLDKQTGIVKILSFIGVGGAIVGFVLTGITVGALAIFASGYEWWVATSFYSSLVGSIIVGIFYILYAVMGIVLKPSETPAK